MKLRTRIATAGAAAALMMPAVQAQTVGGAISDSVQDRLSPGNPIDSRDALESGIRRATGSVIRGNSLNQAVRDGVDQAAQTVERRVNPDGTIQSRATVNGQTTLNNQGYGNQGYMTSQGRALYQGNDGRWFYLNGNGQAVYTSAPQQMRNNHSQYYGHQNGHASSNVAYQDQSQRGRLGASIEETDQGVRVTHVVRGSVAEKAGLRTGDVIVTADGQKIESPNALGQRIADADANSQMTLVVKRDGQEQELRASLGAKANASSSSNRSMQSKEALNNRVNQLEQQLNELRTTIDDLRSDLKADTTDAATEATQPFASTIQNGVNDATAATRDAAENVGNTAKNATESTKSTANKAANQAKDAAKKTGEAVENATESVSNSLGLDQ
ncbi:PDZ domain-containing protein [Rhodopirellula sp. MGV]|uniref:PDZ domain-containing protein n=1 Tax=Rhodopirellula sp. MGV TaxID=2023130 RepID=UPI001303FDAB|nr:PDZ domain-containing protein [Rhodopirellula sp. MGV]